MAFFWAMLVVVLCFDWPYTVLPLFILFLLHFLFKAKKPEPIPTFPPSEGARRNLRRITAPTTVPDHDPSTLFDVDVPGDVMRRLREKPICDLTVFECRVLMQKGVFCVKNKTFGRRALRWMWLAPTTDKIQWISKKEGKLMDEIILDHMTNIEQKKKQVVIEYIRPDVRSDINRLKRLSVKFRSTAAAGLWVRGLSGLIAPNTRITEDLGVALSRDDRSEYCLANDTFSGTRFHHMASVNSYVVLCRSDGHGLHSGHRVVFSPSQGKFFGMRYVKRKASPFLLRSAEEIAMLKALSHRNLLKYHECLVDEERGGHYLVFEHTGLGTLMDHRKVQGRESRETLTEPFLRGLMEQLLSALDYLHAQHIVHGDVRPETLLRSNDGTVKVNAIGCITQDFTELRKLGLLTRARLDGRSCAFIAPEQCWLIDDAPIAHANSSAMDVWAVGAVLYYLVFQTMPFKGNDDAVVQYAICKSKVQIPSQSPISSSLRSLLTSILNEKNPKMRVTLGDLRRHSWFLEGTDGTTGTSQNNALPEIIVRPSQVATAVGKARVQESWRVRCANPLNV